MLIGLSIVEEFLLTLRFEELKIDLMLLVGEFFAEAFIDLIYYSCGEFESSRFLYDLIISPISLFSSVRDFLFLLRLDSLMKS